ncbi:MAG: uracil-DNA glycosylase [Thermoguttaceae bacterium]
MRWRPLAASQAPVTIRRIARILTPMTAESTTRRQRAARALAQRLESLRAAGVTHLGRAATVAAAEGARAQAAEGPGSTSPDAPSLKTRPTPLHLPPSAVRLPSECPVGESSDPRAAALAEVARRVAACTRCAELVRNRTQTVFGTGSPHARLVFIGEAPGADEDRRGEPFVGRAGQLLTDIIVKGMKLRRQDVYIMNILRCRPPDNRTPLPVEAAACREYLDAQLAIIQPEFICCLGACAAQHLLGTDTAIGRLRGRLHDFNGIKVLCTYHPAYVLRNPAAKRQVWDDIQILMAEMAK